MPFSVSWATPIEDLQGFKDRLAASEDPEAEELREEIEDLEDVSGV